MSKKEDDNSLDNNKCRLKSKVNNIKKNVYRR